MITAEAFLSIEASLTKRLVKDLSLATKEVYSKVSEALASGNTDLAMQEFNRLSLDKVFEKNKPYILYVTNMAMLFGASRVTQQPGTSVVGMGFEKMSALQLANALEQMILQKGETFLKTEGAKYILPPEVVQKANPYHDELGRFSTKDSAKTVSGEVSLGHGTAFANSIREEGFKLNPKNGKLVRTFGNGVYLTSDKEVAAKFGELIEVKVKGKFKALSDNEFDDFLFSDEFSAYEKAKKASGATLPEDLPTTKGTAWVAEWFKDKGYDGLFLTKGTSYPDNTTYVVFDPKKIKIQKGEVLALTLYAVPPESVTRKAKKAERILQPFQSFMDSTGKAFIQLASSLHTSRVSAYGFTAEAMVLGMEEYQITEQLDTRTCPVCRLMHGKTFAVKDARALLDVVTRSVDPDDLKQLQPWPSQTKAAVEAMAKLTPRELVMNGWHIPPFHPLCRGLLTRVGKVPSLDSVKDGSYQEKYEATQEDFKALRVPCNPAQLKLWNTNVGLAPGEVVARLTGTPIDEFFSGLIDAPKPKEYAGIYSFSMAKNITIRLTKQGFGSKNPFDQGVMIKPESKSLYLDALDLVEADQGAGVAKRYMREFYTLAKDMELEKMELVAGLDMGGYAWAKYGFFPTKTSWDALKGDLATRYAQVKTALNLTPLEEAEYLAIMASPDPKTIFTLSDAHFGKELLRGQLWEGSLPLSDKESVTRFLSYIGELK